MTNEALRQVEEAFCQLIELTEPNVTDFQRQALASLRTLLEGDAGEDKEILRNYILGVTKPDSECRKEMLVALAYLSVKAKLGASEILKAKREVLVRVEKELRKRQMEMKYNQEDFRYADAQDVVDELMQRWGFEEGDSSVQKERV